MTVDRYAWVRIPFLTAGLYLLFVSLFSSSIADYDLWGYLAFGRIFWEEGYFPFQDVFSYTPTKPVWIYHEWLTGVLFYFIYDYSGAVGLQFFRYFIVLITIYLMYQTAVMKGGDSLWGVVALIPAVVLISFGYVPVRAQIFTYLFFVITLYILERAKKDLKWSLLWWLLPIQVLWCNLHGGFLAGLGLILLYALGEGFSRRKTVPFITIGAMATLVTLINPYGIGYWQYAIEAVAMPRPEINEWISLPGALQKGIHGVPVTIFIVMTVTYCFFTIFRSRKDYTELLVLAVTIYLGIKHVRHNVFFGLIFGSFLPVVLTESWAAFKKRRIGDWWPWVPQGGLGVLLLSVYLFSNPSLSFTLSPSFGLATPSPQFPVGAFKWIKSKGFQGNILPQFEWGEFLIWYFSPQCRVAMDGRYETVYPQPVTRAYFLFLSGREEGREFLRKYPHDLVLVKPDSGADFLMQKEPAWQKVFSDSGCVLYLRPIRNVG